METLIGIGLIIAIIIICKIPEWQHDNMTCQPGKEIDWNKSHLVDLFMILNTILLK